MRKLTVALVLVVGLVLPQLVFANDTYSTISTTFQIQRQVKCDKLTMAFRVWAKGNTYTEAIKRLKPLNNNFMEFLHKIYDKKEIKTQIPYSGSTTAEIFITVNTEKIKTASAVLHYIAGRKFPYQTGIEMTNLRYSVTQKTLNKVRQSILKEALIKSKQLLKIVNSTMGKKYQISNVNITYGQLYTANEFTPRLLFKSASVSSKNLNISAGARTITATVKFSAISKIE